MIQVPKPQSASAPLHSIPDQDANEKEGDDHIGSQRSENRSGPMQIPVRRSRRIRRKVKGRKHGQHAHRLGR